MTERVADFRSGETRGTSATCGIRPCEWRWQLLLRDWADYVARCAKVTDGLLEEARLYSRLGAEAADENRQQLWYAWAGVALQEALDPLPDVRRALEARRSDLLRMRAEPAVPLGASIGSPVVPAAMHPPSRHADLDNRPATDMFTLKEGTARPIGNL